MRLSLVTFAMVAAAMPVTAWARPLILPSRDVVVEYRSRGMLPGPAGEASNTVTVRFGGDRDRIRIDGQFGGLYAILDVGQARLTMVMPARRLYVDEPADPYMMAVFQPGGAAFRRTGAATVVGLPCTVYDATVNDRSGQVCLTDDGVLLRASLSTPDSRPELEALSVTYARQPAELFEVPARYRRLDMPFPLMGIVPGILGRDPQSGWPGGNPGR
jgi:hypothetical protein